MISFKFIPTTIDQLWEFAMMLNNGQNDKAHEMVLCYAQFGGHFNHDLGLMMGQVSVIRGKPTLNADAVAGICRRSSLMRMCRIVEWTTELCSFEMARHDEEETHIYTFTYKMAAAQGLTRNQNWDKMRLQMLRARALTMGCRALFPDAVSGIYSTDEIADNTPMSDRERALLIADSIGEKISTAPPAEPAPA